MENQYGQIIANLIAVLAFIFVLLYLLKKFKFTKYNTDKYIKIINAVSIGPKEKVVLIEVNNTVLLIGATPNHIETLYVFDSLTERDVATKEVKSRFAEQAASIAN